MDNEQAAFWLEQFIGKNLRVHASDGRVFGGQMKCTDKVSLLHLVRVEGLVLRFIGPQHHLGASARISRSFCRVDSQGCRRVGEGKCVPGVE
jgi:hypothetical protein